MENKKILVTGGAGFLGSHFVRKALSAGASRLVNVDALTYAGDTRRLADLEGDSRYEFVEQDIAAPGEIERLFDSIKPHAVVHYAADTHVTRSESDPERFYRTNVEGTRALLDAAVAAGVERFLHVSTDEVYGSILDGAFKEVDKIEGDIQASSPYAKSKSQGDDLALSYADRLDVVVARPTNAFGPWQFPEKALPRWITRALRGENLLVWGDGLYIRQWLFAEDFADAIALLLEKGERGEAYNVGPTHEPEIANIDLARWIVSYLGLDPGRIEMTAYDRPDHDRRYAVDSTRLTDLGWRPGEVWDQFAATVDWYSQNRAWWESHIAEAESIYTDSTSKA